MFVCLFVCLVASLCPILASFFRIEALIELRKMLLRKKLFDVRLRNCSTPKDKVLIVIFCRFTGFTKMQSIQLLEGGSVLLLDTLFFQNELEVL